MFDKNKIRRQASQVSDTIRSFDFFQLPIPGFNIEGRAGVGTLLGSLISITLTIVMSLYGALKFDILVNRLNPSIDVVTVPKELEDHMTYVNLRDDTSMRIAFSVRNSSDKKTKMDPRYIKIITRVLTKDV